MQSFIKFQSFASARDIQNLDFPESTFLFFWPPKMASTCRKQTMERDSDGDKNKVFVRIIDNLYVIIHDRMS